MPEGGQLLSSTSVSDEGSSASTLVVSANGRPATVARFYRDLFTDDGWQMVLQSTADGPQVLQLEKPDERIELVVGECRWRWQHCGNQPGSG